jgi:hypothetical protein
MNKTTYVFGKTAPLNEIRVKGNEGKVADKIYGTFN